ncbi:DUF1365 domain-containing protein [Hydrogenovibrio sp. 3SP14C1]|uniref:DUF1365 domain-containing protein n=1 Tax=Hydrogenovibrio sp. 3SP14C1 TaxID=3038774 RepID=UPI0024177656|nr:DUF1365 domain-containing protein [Hydrogenovibrio sp. 3SP14C1]MDG4811511.1 DUF1365 domain-containing protein [Hydrogenovibrio sp. 3SP14C1]
MPSHAYICEVMHQRLRPFQYRFNYKVFNLRIDIDHIATESDQLKWLSIDRFNLVSLYTKDFGARDPDVSWREWADTLFADYGLLQPAARIELVCSPRMLGVVFNPLAIWYAYSQSNDLIGIIAEVSNTFCQWHHYVLTHQGAPLMPHHSALKARANKDFHVSPFISMEAFYQFRFYAPSDHYKLSIKQYEQNQPTLVATQTGKQTPLSNAFLLKATLLFPVNSVKVLFLIHWWALKIWVKGGKFHSTPKNLSQTKHSDSEMTSC